MRLKPTIEDIIDDRRDSTLDWAGLNNNPNIDYLKKEAKKLRAYTKSLKHLRAHAPGCF